LGIRSSLESSGQTDQILPTDSPIVVIEGAKDNLPDESSVEAAKRISKLVESLSQEDLLIVLVSLGIIFNDCLGYSIQFSRKQCIQNWE